MGPTTETVYKTRGTWVSRVKCFIAAPQGRRRPITAPRSGLAVGRWSDTPKPSSESGGEGTCGASSGSGAPQRMIAWVRMRRCFGRRADPDRSPDPAPRRMAARCARNLTDSPINSQGWGELRWFNHIAAQAYDGLITRSANNQAPPALWPVDGLPRRRPGRSVQRLLRGASGCQTGRTMPARMHPRL